MPRRTPVAGGTVVAGLAAVAAATLTVSPAGSTPQMSFVTAPEAERITVVSHGSAAYGQPQLRKPDERGYTVSTAGLVGHTPRGLDVWVDPDAPHAQNLAQHSKATVRIWRGLGIRSRYRGFGTPKLDEGVVTVTEGPDGCTGGRVGVAYQSWESLPTDKWYVHSGRVVICPGLYKYGSWQWSSTIRHELGHAAGLGHFDGTFRGTTQVMRSVNSGGVSTFQAGDLNGLRFFARNNRTVKSLIPPHGEVGDIDWSDNAVDFSGWARLDQFRGKPVQIRVTDNGRPLPMVAVTRPRSGGRFQLSVPVGEGSHSICLSAVSTVNRAATRSLGCASFSR